ncbi:MAG TPA: hypothetical protein VMU81_00270 [Acetobacteraceae bacterium]|nr:hypothetical protein [Acetobacteraceae bacterium]
MRKILLAVTILGLAAAPAFAGGIAAGDLNIAGTSASSNAGVSSMQGTGTGAMVAGNGGVAVGAVSGNYTSVDTSALGAAGPKGSYTNTTATQTNVGGTVVGGVSGKGFMGIATGGAGGSQTSSASGGASATAKNLNAGGIATVGRGR